MAEKTKTELVLPAKGLGAEETLFCGQSFSWHRLEDGGFAGVAGKKSVAMQEKDGALVLRNIDGASFLEEDEDFWRHYFALDINYEELRQKFSENQTLAKCVEYSPAIRVLRQPFFDTLLCFIISQNNNIPRITGIVRRMCAAFGTPINAENIAPKQEKGQAAEDEGYYTFPDAARLAECSLEDFAPLRAGFRAKYLLDAAKKVADGTVDEKALMQADDETAREMLMQIKGVGPKVADCVLLYSLGRTSVVPMDVWMKRAMAQLFEGEMPPEAKGYEGIAQQYIFNWARFNLFEK